MCKKSILLLSALLSIAPTALYAQQIHSPSSIKFIPSQSDKGMSQSLDISMIRHALIQHGIEIGQDKSYYRAFVQPIAENGQHFLLIYLLENKVNGFKTVKAQLGADGNIEKIIMPYHLNSQELKQQRKSKKAVYCPDLKVNAVIASYFYNPTDPSSYDDTKAMDRIIRLSKLEGYKTVLLWNNASDPDKIDTVSNEQNWLSCPNVKEIVINSHGSPDGYLAQDGILGSDYFSQYQQTTGHPLQAVITTNACEVMQNPIKQSIETAGATGYIASTTSVLHKFSPEDLTFMAYQYFHNGGSISEDNVATMLHSVDPIHATTDGMYWGGLSFGQIIDPDMTITVEKASHPMNDQSKTTTVESGEVVFRFSNSGVHSVQSITVTQNGEKVTCPLNGSTDYPFDIKQPTMQLSTNNGKCSASVPSFGDWDDYIADPDITR